MLLKKKSRIFSRGIFAAALLSLLAFVPALSPAAHAQDHLVSSQAMQSQVQSTSAQRQQNISDLTHFLSSPEAEHAMQQHHVNPQQVQAAIPTLSNQELASLASRANHAQQQFAAGAISHGMWLVVIIAIVVVIVVIAIH